jgi:hypothetical protein
MDGLQEKTGRDAPDTGTGGGARPSRCRKKRRKIVKKAKKCEVKKYELRKRWEVCILIAEAEGSTVCKWRENDVRFSPLEGVCDHGR